MKYRYAVIICLKCKKARTIEQENKTTTCPFCHTKKQVKNMKIQFETNNQEEARKIIGLIHARQDGKQDEVLAFP